MATVYILQGAPGCICISSVSSESDEWQSNHVEYMDSHYGKQASYEGMRNTLVNILKDAGVTVVEE